MLGFGLGLLTPRFQLLAPSCSQCAFHRNIGGGDFLVPCPDRLDHFSFKVRIGWNLDLADAATAIKERFRRDSDAVFSSLLWSFEFISKIG